MDKRIFMICLICLLAVGLVAAQQGSAGSGNSQDDADSADDSDPDDVDSISKGSDAAGKNVTGSQKDDNETGKSDNGQAIQQDTQNKGEETVLLIQQRTELKAQSKEELKSMIQAKQQEMEQEMAGLSEEQQKVYRNQNTVREAVHALLAMEDLAGGIGPQVSAIARDFNNSVQATIRAEEKVENRSGFKRFFAGGDADAAEEIDAQVEQNRIKLQELKRLQAECDCDAEVKALLQEQIQNMEQEQNRLSDLAAKEKKSKGMLGWIWK